MTEITAGLEFPEGPVWMPDGTVCVVELNGGRITRVFPDGRKETVAEPGGSPNGMAIGPEGGWAPDEEALFDAHGWQAVSLGPRVLRVETAAIAALALVGSMLE